MATKKETIDNCYSLLHLSKEADLNDLKKAYKTRVKAWHPDKLPSTSKRLQNMATEKLNELNCAYEILEKHIKAVGKRPKRKPNSKKKEKKNTSSSKSSPISKDTKSNNKQTLSNPGSFTEEMFHTLPNGDKYAGEIVDGKPHGEGIYIFSGGNRYVGEFKKGKPHGVGEFTFATGDKYIGQFREDSMEGQGTYHYANGDIYSGEFKAGQPHGEGSYTVSSGKQVRGVWENGCLTSEL